MKAYKIVSCLKFGKEEEDEHYYSYCSVEGINYFIGKSVSHNPFAGPLAVFDTSDNAKNFLDRDSNGNVFGEYKIFEVEYEPYEFLTNERKGLWFSNNIVKYTKLPEGTLFAETVRLVKEVEL